jgi:hypothetical protein
MPDTAGNMAVMVTGNYFNGSFGAKSNSLSVYYRYKTVGGSYSSWTAMTVTKSGNTYSATVNITGLDYKTAYVFQAYAKDELATFYSAEKTVKATPVFDWGESDFKFNVPVTMAGYTDTPEAITITETGTTDALLLEQYQSMPVASVKAVCLKQSVQDSLPVGGTWFITMYKTNDSYGVMAAIRYYSATACVECRKTLYAGTWSGWDKVLTAANVVDAVYPVNSIYISYSRTSPAELFGGSWHRMQSIFLWGTTTEGTIGATAGEMTHTLTIDEIPSHSHKALKWNTKGTDTAYVPNTDGNMPVSYSLPTNTAGGGQAHNNMPPYVNVAIWRRTA